MSFITRERTWGLGLAAIILLLDQFIKYLMVEPLALRNQPNGQIELLPFFDLTWTQNYGVSLGMFTATSLEARFMLVGFTALIALVVLVWMMRETKLGDILPLGMILGGALGNIYDRWAHGFVIDYADLHIGEFRPFLIFNLADAAISIGVVIILARSLFLREKQPDETEQGENQPTEMPEGQVAETN